MEKIMANDVRADAVLQKACNTDISTFCADVEPGKGRVHECLRNHRDKLSKQCAAEELKLNIIQSSDIRLRPGFKVSKQLLSSLVLALRLELALRFALVRAL